MRRKRVLQGHGIEPLHNNIRQMPVIENRNEDIAMMLFGNMGLAVDSSSAPQSRFAPTCRRRFWFTMLPSIRVKFKLRSSFEAKALLPEPKATFINGEARQTWDE